MSRYRSVPCVQYFALLITGFLCGFFFQPRKHLYLNVDQTTLHEIHSRRPRCGPIFNGSPHPKSDHGKPGAFILGSCEYEYIMDWGLAAAIASFWIDEEGTEDIDVLELGAGCGCYTDYYKWLGFSIQAYDGVSNILDLTNGLVSTIDLGEKQNLRDAHWVLSLEVGEHISGDHMDIYLQNVVRHAKKGVVLSWALPGQTESPAHPNQMSNEEVIAEMQKLGMRHYPKATEWLRSNAGNICCGYFKSSVMVFTRDEN